jgi:hypothetical protein
LPHVNDKSLHLLVLKGKNKKAFQKNRQKLLSMLVNLQGGML